MFLGRTKHERDIVYDNKVEGTSWRKNVHHLPTWNPVLHTETVQFVRYVQPPLLEFEDRVRDAITLEDLERLVLDYLGFSVEKMVLSFRQISLVGVNDNAIPSTPTPIRVALGLYQGDHVSDSGDADYLEEVLRELACPVWMRSVRTLRAARRWLLFSCLRVRTTARVGNHAKRNLRLLSRRGRHVLPAARRRFIFSCLRVSSTFPVRWLTCLII